ncbi:uncharacterized protein N0V96_006265 [Colletotrichum fioriniae]|uniref:uncharacterized protein n=1 Tax=Colletotrichum fioriniae TaxID=710243 RepID=UPI0032DAE315|nr:hypothetical protein N0V96_006265 [Colletotrichum fioriniae]
MMDKGSGAANDTQPLNIDDFTAALEFDFITSNFVNNQQLDITSFGPGQVEISQDLQSVGSIELLGDLGVESCHQQDAFAIGPAAPTALGSQHVSMDFAERQPVNNVNQFDEPSVFLFSEALGDGEPMGHLYYNAAEDRNSLFIQVPPHSEDMAGQQQSSPVPNHGGHGDIAATNRPQQTADYQLAGQHPQTDALQSAAKTSAFSSDYLY